MSLLKNIRFDLTRLLGDSEQSGKPWARSITKIQAFAETASARIIGLTGDRRGVGVSTLARATAQAYASFGEAVLLVDTSRATPDYRDASEAMAFPAATADAANPRLHTLALSSVPIITGTGDSPFRLALDGTTNRVDTIVIDLPPPSIDGEPVPAFKTLATACDLVLLVSVTGGVSRATFENNLAACKVSGVALGGIILNDWKLSAGQLLATT
jgi:Mrp family chromosome partitioning ATPase